MVRRALLIALCVVAAGIPTAAASPGGGRPVVVQVESGFRWRDALIGGAGLLGLELAAAGGALALRAWRTESIERRQ